MFVSATPGEYEFDHELLRAEQIIRPTGLLDPKVEVRPIEGQIDDLVAEVNKEIEKKNKSPDHDSDQTYGRGPYGLYEGSGNPCPVPPFRH